MARKGLKIIVWVVFAVYFMAVLFRTIFSRAAADDYQYNFALFWSYAAIQDGKDYLIEEHYLNVLLFIPLGVLLWFLLERKCWWKALLYGIAFSLVIEALQLILKRGMCELDDVFHNTIGCLVGYGLVCLVSLIWKKKPIEEGIV